MKASNKPYEAPQAKVLEIESQGVLCASGGGAAAAANPNGGINGMNNGNTYGWN